MTTTPFEHSPLDSADPRAIQILELLPSRNLKGPIRCELHHHSLDQDVEYEALSYTWGEPEPGHTVLVNGSHTLEVTPNCIQAMSCLRRRFHRRTLWIDAICIDQRENDASRRDRERQVKIMSIIYRKAEKVLVWLGPSESTSARTIARLKLIAKVNAVRESTDLGYSTLCDLQDRLSFGMIDGSKLPSPPWPRYRAFASMMHSPWWQRVWTLQEQILARQCEAYHGRHRIRFSHLQADRLRQTIIERINGDEALNYDCRRQIHKQFQTGDAYLQQFRAQDSLEWTNDSIAEYLLQTAFLLQAKHPIDKIYGLHSIFTTYCNLPLSPPDYKKTAEDVYEETVWTWINTRGDLSILKLASRPFILRELPSWVPAWHQQHPRFIRNIGNPGPENFRMMDRNHFNWKYSHCTHRASVNSSTGEFIPVACVFPEGKLRVLRARFAGRVSHAVGPERSIKYDRYLESKDRCLYLHLDWCKLVHDVFLHRATEKEALHEMFRSLCYPGIHQSEPRDGERLDDAFQHFKAWFDFMLYLNEELAPPILTVSEVGGADHGRSLAMNLYHDVNLADEEEEATNVLESRYGGSVEGREGLTKLARGIRAIWYRLLYMRNHALCILDFDDMIAITDYWCREGDEVFVFPGTDSPFILRKQPDGDCYRLVGPALVDRLLRRGYQNWRSEGDGLQDIVLI